MDYDTLKHVMREVRALANLYGASASPDHRMIAGAENALEAMEDRLRAMLAMASELVPKPKPDVTLVHADTLKPGDRVMVECEVFDDRDSYPSGAHVVARPAGGWNVGYDGVWCHRRTQKSRPNPWVQLKETSK